MKLSQCKLGEIVEHYAVKGSRIGHIVGLTKAFGTRETIPLVRFAAEQNAEALHDGAIFTPTETIVYAIHPANLSLLEDDA